MDWGISTFGVMLNEKECGTMPIELPDARQLSNPVLEALRLRALRGCELGHNENKLAAIVFGTLFVILV